jgi:excisionase family DNA binding protein
MRGIMRIMTVKEVADFLRLKEPTVCRLASDGKLPGVKVGKSWRFDMEALERLVAGTKAGMIDQAEGERTENLKK